MSKLIMMRGLPASGKTTRAKEMMNEYGNFVRINKDSLRKMLHEGKWTGKKEGITRSTSRLLASHFLKLGQNVIIDDTNLGEGHKQSWSSLAEESEAKFVIRNISASLDLCLDRDLNRENSVGVHIIMGMALQYEIFKPKKGLVLCDMDGTLADIKHRLHYVRDVEKKDWKSFFEGIDKDIPRFSVLNHVMEYQREGCDIIIITARPEEYRDVTETWLRNYLPELKYQTIVMRRSGDKRPDTEVKKGMYDTYFQHYNVEVVFDDRPSVIRMWQSNGVRVEDVGAGIEF